MKRILVFMGVMVVLLLGGCAGETTPGKSLLGDKPPRMEVVIGGERYEAKLGTYCWNSRTGGVCVDTAGAVEMMKAAPPIEVQPDESLELLMEETPQPNERHLVQSINETSSTNIPLNGSTFSAPTEAGIYYYDYSVRWHDEENFEISLGDAHYAFVIEVK